jgi:hypothetical protein
VFDHDGRSLHLVVTDDCVELKHRYNLNRTDSGPTYIVIELARVERDDVTPLVRALAAVAPCPPGHRLCAISEVAINRLREALPCIADLPAGIDGEGEGDPINEVVELLARDLAPILKEL